MSLGAQVLRGANEPANGWRVHRSLSQHAATRSMCMGNCPPYMAWRNCRNMVKSERCFSLQCQETHSSTRRKFARCAQCNRVPYCSRACQQAVWDDPVAPHKQICHALNTFSAIVQIPKHAGKDYTPNTDLFQNIPVDVINEIVHNTERLFEQKLLAMASFPQYGERLNQWVSRHQHLLFSGSRTDLLVTKRPGDD